MIEEDSGLRKKRSPVEKAAEMWAVCVHALRGMERMSPRPSEEVFEQNRGFLKEFEEKLRGFAEAGEDNEEAKRLAIEKQRASELEQQALKWGVLQHKRYTTKLPGRHRARKVEPKSSLAHSAG